MLRRWAVCAVALAMMGSAPVLAKKEFAGNTVYTDYGLTYVKLAKISAADATTAGVDHPATVTVEKMRQMLGSIALNRQSMFKKGKIIESGAVFGERDVDAFAAYVVDGLARANNRQVVVFSYRVQNTRVLGGMDRLNAGKIWVSGGKLHVAFDQLYALLTDDTTKRGYESKTMRDIKGLRVSLEAGAGQELGANAQEIVLDMGKTFVATSSPTKPVKMPSTVTERLEELKKLHDKKLITDEEYNAKRDAIMRNL